MFNGNTAGLMKQAQQDAGKHDEGASGAGHDGGRSATGGAAKVTMTCKHDVKRVSIDPSVVDDTREMLEDLIAAAMNDGAKNSRANPPSTKMGGFAAG